MRLSSQPHPLLALRGIAGCRCGGHGKGDGEQAARAGLGFDGHGAAHLFDESAGDRQAGADIAVSEGQSPLKRLKYVR